MIAYKNESQQKRRGIWANRYVCQDVPPWAAHWRSGASALAGSGAAGTLAERAWAQDAGESGGNAADKGAQYGFLIKARNCVDCGECVKASRLSEQDARECRGAPRKAVPYVTKSGKEA